MQKNRIIMSMYHFSIKNLNPVSRTNLVAQYEYDDNSLRLDQGDIRIRTTNGNPPVLQNPMAVIEGFFKNHLNVFKNYDDEIIGPKKPPYREVSYRAMDVEVNDRMITGYIEMGGKGFPSSVVEILYDQDGNHISNQERYAIKKKDTHLHKLFFSIYVPDYGSTCIMITQTLSGKGSISCLRRSMPVYFKNIKYALKIDFIPLYTEIVGGMIPDVKAIKVETRKKKTAQEKLITSDPSRRIMKPTFKGILKFPDGFMNWSEIDDAKDKDAVITEKLKGFYSTTDLESVEHKYKLVVKLDGLERTLDVENNMEISTGIDLTDQVELDGEGQAERFSLEFSVSCLMRVIEDEFLK